MTFETFLIVGHETQQACQQGEGTWVLGVQRTLRPGITHHHVWKARSVWLEDGTGKIGRYLGAKGVTTCRAAGLHPADVDATERLQ